MQENEEEKGLKTEYTFSDDSLRCGGKLVL